MPRQLPSKTKGRLFYGWIVVGSSFIIFALIFGTRYCFGVFFKSLGNEFGLTRTATSIIFSMYMMLCPVFAIVAGWVLDRYGPRAIVFSMGFFGGLSLLLTSQATSSWQLFVTYSVIFAIGTGPTYSVLMSTVSRWFEKKRGLALGITGSGGGVGTIVLALCAAYLIAKFDWRTAYIVLGLIVGLGIIPLSVLVKKDPAEIGIFPDGVNIPAGRQVVMNGEDTSDTGSLTVAQAFGTRDFWFLGIVWLSFSLCLHLVLTHIVPYGTDVGISATEAAVILGLIGSISIPGRLVIGGVSDRIGRKASALICAMLQIGAMIWLTWARELWMFYLFAIVYGFAFGGFDILVTALIGDIFGLHSLGTIMGMLVVGWGIGAAFGPAVGGLIFDVFQNYFMAFMIGALAMMVAASFIALTKKEIGKSV
jgi:MFS family permease